MVLQPQLMLTQVTSHEDIYQASHSSLWRHRKGFTQLFSPYVAEFPNTCKWTLVCKSFFSASPHVWANSDNSPVFTRLFSFCFCCCFFSFYAKWNSDAFEPVCIQYTLVNTLLSLFVIIWRLALPWHAGPVTLSHLSCVPSVFSEVSLSAEGTAIQQLKAALSFFLAFHSI